jgi:hypothetical protein
MSQERSSAYQGTTREAAENAYHADARVMAHMGYAPTLEEWSTVLGRQMLTVTYLYAPERAPAVLEALAEIAAEAVVPADPSTAAATAGPRGLEDIRSRLKDAPEPETAVERPVNKLIVLGLPLIAAGLAIGFLLGAIFDSGPILMLVIVLGLPIAGLWIGMLVPSLLNAEGKSRAPEAPFRGGFRSPNRT